MKEHAILFSTDMVRALLNGTKTQTRRTVNSKKLVTSKDCRFDSYHENEYYFEIFENNEPTEKYFSIGKCPYGQVGDVLWVRETFYAYGHWVKNGTTKKGTQKWKFQDWTLATSKAYLYADCPPKQLEKKREITGWRKRPSLFMPKHACRIKLQITERSIERLHEISEADAIAEGVEEIEGDMNWRPSFYDPDSGGHRNCYRNYLDDMEHGYPTRKPDGSFEHFPYEAKESYYTLWEKLNGKESLDSNPFVWVVEFKRIEQN